MAEERIYLAGFMTSGKSTIGPILANVLGWDFYDLDQVIEEEEGKSVVEIFEAKGETYFRNRETETLKSLSGLDKVVVSLGGGAMAHPENYEIIRNGGISIYLKASPEAIYKRLRHKIDRPLFRDLVLSEKPESEFVKRIAELLEQREPYYEKADIVINTDETRIGYTVDALAKKIIRALNDRKYSSKK